MEDPDGHAVLRQAVNNMMHASSAPSCSSFRVLILREKRTNESGQVIMHDKDIQFFLVASGTRYSLQRHY